MKITNYIPNQEEPDQTLKYIRTRLATDLTNQAEELSQGTEEHKREEAEKEKI